VFVKNELHSQKKIDASRWRTIWSVSVVDQLVERVLNTNQNHAEIGEWDCISSKPGMGLNDDGLAKVAKLVGKMSRPAGTDVTGWDMSIQQWQLDWDADMRAVHAGFDPGDNLWKRRARLLGFTLLVFSDGTIAEQTIRGLIKSGAYITSSSGSRARVMMHKVAVGNASGVAAGMGDDCLEDLPNGWTKRMLIDAYSVYGLRIKLVETFEHDGAVEFCSYRFFANGTVEPCNVEKKILNFFYNWPDSTQFDERLDTLGRELRHSPRRDWAFEVISSVRQQLSQRGGTEKEEPTSSA
jgi:hypothetical protein